MSAADLFAGVLEIEHGDVYQALLTAHNFLRESRSDDRVQAALKPIRTDGRDDSGAYYHLFGMAVYAVAFELATSAQLAGPNPLLPEVVAALEEAFVADRSGDVTVAGQDAASTIPTRRTSDSAVPG